jgi:hypothetical protein
VSARAIGESILLELFSDGAGRWTDDDGVRIRELQGAIDVDLGITPVTHSLAVRRLGLGVGETAKIPVACLDVLGGEIRSLKDGTNESAGIEFRWRIPRAASEESADGTR